MSIAGRIGMGFLSLPLLFFGGFDIYSKHVEGTRRGMHYSSDGAAAVATGIGTILGGLGCLAVAITGYQRPKD